jgi:hypothetical protein
VRRQPRRPAVNVIVPVISNRDERDRPAATEPELQMSSSNARGLSRIHLVELDSRRLADRAPERLNGLSPRRRWVRNEVPNEHAENRAAPCCLNARGCPAHHLRRRCKTATSMHPSSSPSRELPRTPTQHTGCRYRSDVVRLVQYLPIGPERSNRQSVSSRSPNKRVNKLA